MALGDSYAAGEGLAPYEEGSGACDRSATQSYPEILRADNDRSPRNPRRR